MKKNKTIFCDIDGTIFKYRKFETYKEVQPELTPGTFEKMSRWKEEGHMIVLTTARPEDFREHTIKELTEAGIVWDKLIMGIERGPRYLINDMDPNKPGVRATAFSIERDEGLTNVNIGGN